MYHACITHVPGLRLACTWLAPGLWPLRKFIVSFTLAFAISFACWVLGNHARIAATTPAEFNKFGIGWSLKLTGEAGFVLALLAGLVIGNFFPKFAGLLKESIKPELFVKAAIVIMGAGVGLKALENSSLAWGIMFRGLCAIIEDYLIYWAVIYFIARKYFKFSPEWAAPLASDFAPPSRQGLAAPASVAALASISMNQAGGRIGLPCRSVNA